MKRVVLFGYGSGWSLVLGALLGGFYLLQGELIALVGIGTAFRPVFNALWLALVGGLIWVNHQTTGPLPKPLGLIRADLQATGRSRYRYLPLQFVVPAVILTSGTSLGPEATLVSTTVLAGLWLLDKLRYLDEHFADSPLAAWLVPWRYLSPQQRPANFWSPQLVAYLAMGIGSFYLTCKYGGEPSVLVSLGHTHWGLRELLWLVPLVGGGIVIGKLELAAMKMLRRILNSRVTRDYWGIAVGGVAIYAASLWLPAINFSGMANFHLLATSWQAKSWWFLIGAALLKLALVTMCLNTGWLGGDIFPVLFCATAQGIALSQALPLDPIFVIGVVAIAVGATILDAPLVAGGVMAVMFLPPQLFGVAAAVTAALLVGKRLRPQIGRFWHDNL